jgi:hypothetical protein
MITVHRGERPGHLTNQDDGRGPAGSGQQPVRRRGPIRLASGND